MDDKQASIEQKITSLCKKLRLSYVRKTLNIDQGLVEIFCCDKDLQRISKFCCLRLLQIIKEFTAIKANLAIKVHQVQFLFNQGRAIPILTIKVDAGVQFGFQTDWYPGSGFQQDRPEDQNQIQTFNHFQKFRK